MSDPPPDYACVLRLEGFEGPLDLLLDLARAQKVDLAKISILALVEQYLAVIEGARRVRLELAADWLVMAAWLTWLKSRLLLPADALGAEEGEQAAEVLAARLRDLSASAPPPPGSAPGRSLARTCSPAARRRTTPRSTAPAWRWTWRRWSAPISARSAAAPASRRYQPRAADPVDACRTRCAGWPRCSAACPTGPAWSASCPTTLGGPLERRAALASTLLAGLEMARGGAVRLRQEHAFGPILVRRGRAGVEEAAHERHTPPPEEGCGELTAEPRRSRQPAASAPTRTRSAWPRRWCSPAPPRSAPRALSQLLPDGRGRRRGDRRAARALCRARRGTGGDRRRRAVPHRAGPRAAAAQGDRGAAPAAARGDGDAGDHRLPPARAPAPRSRRSAAPACRSRPWTRCWRRPGRAARAAARRPAARRCGAPRRSSSRSSA